MHSKPLPTDGYYIRTERRDAFAMIMAIDEKYGRQLKELAEQYEMHKQRIMNERRGEMLSQLTKNELARFGIKFDTLTGAYDSSRTKSGRPKAKSLEFWCSDEEGEDFNDGEKHWKDEVMEEGRGMKFEEESEEMLRNSGFLNGVGKWHPDIVGKGRRLGSHSGETDGVFIEPAPVRNGINPSARNKPAGPIDSVKMGVASCVHPKEEGRFFELCANQFGRGADAACTAICFFACMRMKDVRLLNAKTFASSIQIDWEEVMRLGCEQWKRIVEAQAIAQRKRLGPGTHTPKSSRFLHVDDLLQDEVLRIYLEDMEAMAYNGPLFEEQTKSLSDEDKAIWVFLKRALALFYNVSHGSDAYDRDPKIASTGVTAVVTIKNTSLALWGGKKTICIFDPHGMSSANRKATLEVHDDLDVCYRRILTLCHSTSASDTGSLLTNQYTMYTFKPEPELISE